MDFMHVWEKAHTPKPMHASGMHASGNGSHTATWAHPFFPKQDCTWQPKHGLVQGSRQLLLKCTYMDTLLTACFITSTVALNWLVVITFFRWWTGAWINRNSTSALNPPTTNITPMVQAMSLPYLPSSFIHWCHLHAQYVSSISAHDKPMPPHVTYPQH